MLPCPLRHDYGRAVVLSFHVWSNLHPAFDKPLTRFVSFSPPDRGLARLGFLEIFFGPLIVRILSSQARNELVSSPDYS